MAWFSLGKLKEGLQKTRAKLAAGMKAILTIGRKIDAECLDEIEEMLLASDIGPQVTMKIIGDLQQAYKDKKIEDASQVLAFLKSELKESLRGWDAEIQFSPTPPTVILVAGVNGSGKTTSIAKLANLLKKDGKQVLLAASDTFRAAAVEQLEIWSQRIGVDIVRHQTGADPGAVAFDALEAALARGSDVVIVDTAGRLHTERNLMNELQKIHRVVGKKIPGAPHEVLLVLDATTGQNAVSQAKLFTQAIGVTGIILAKLDGTAKGGIVLGMRNQIDIPVKLVGVGEKAEDIQTFNADAFVDALFE
ncbi:MAG: signal recognition particle-docking protein FtsY [Planctomycetes bacterium]|nr:signal recognition particle-docking protein FtsY [Planctomycetota bacterium]